MENIAEWLKKIVTIIVFAGFLEMLLPNNNLKGATRLVLGLLVMTVLFMPLVSVFKVPLNIEGVLRSNIQSNQIQPATSEVIQQGHNMRGDWNLLFQQNEQKRIKERIEQALILIDGLQVTKVFLDYDGRNIKNISVNVHSYKLLTFEEQNSMNEQIQRLLYFVTNLPEEQIEVIWDARK